MVVLRSGYVSLHEVVKGRTIMSFSFDNSLFVTDEGRSMRFNIEKCSNSGELKEYIEHAGGTVQNSDTAGPFTITLQDDGDECPDNVEVFSSRYIISCCLKNQLLDLNKFRCKSQNVFNKDFDAMRILRQETSWEDAEKFLDRTGEKDQPKNLSTPSPIWTKASSSGTSISPDNSHTKKVTLTRAFGPLSTSTCYSKRCEFTQKERREIVQYLVDIQGYNDIRGTAMWKRMSRKFPNHTWQSLKEHFIKKIMPLIGSYGLPMETVKKFRAGMQAPTIRPKPPILNTYSLDDDNAILQYVSKYGKNAKLGGNVFWQTMKERNILPGRSWQSVRERYLKCLRNKSSNTPASSSCASPSRIEASETPASSSGSDSDSDSDSPKEKQSKKRRKLYTLSHDRESPSADVPICSPSSVKRRPPSMLEILRRNCKKSKKRLVTHQESDDDQSKNEKPQSGGENPCEDRGETVNDIQSDTTVELPLPNGSSKGVSNPSNDNILDESLESDESDWSLDGLRNRGIIIKYKEPSSVADNRGQSGVPPVISCANQDMNCNMEANNNENVAEEDISCPPEVAQKEFTEERFDFLGDMTLLSQPSTKTNRSPQRSVCSQAAVSQLSAMSNGATQGSVCSQEAESAVCLSGPENPNNSSKSGQLVDVPCKYAKSQRSLAPFSENPGSGLTFNPSVFSTQKHQKLTEDKAVQIKEKVNVATQTDPVLVLCLQDGSEENLLQLLHNPQERPSTPELQNSDVSVGSPSPVPATFNTVKSRHLTRYQTRSAVRDSESDEGLSPKFTPRRK
ncbi:Telomeric repeat-binding factor 2-interacting protein 1 [Frankliniella fusca]|uniref:Telomeric repeat-binding factor 2-interacting protein 1 n=1 Tax=Frankliniella fusca TaxID=407009 RepID=A0AAE1HWP4_9NEOP|nr:Telomeric repeat-binding factor 2-interacting protein 1 [Frankliniella fusca]